MDINVVCHAPQDAVGLHMFDFLHSWLQSQHRDDNYRTDINIDFSESLRPECVNILFAYMPTQEIQDLDLYDIVIMDNGDEQLEVSTEAIHAMFQKHSHAYLLANAYLSKDHPLQHRVIPTMFDCWKFRLYNLIPYYPQYHELMDHRPRMRLPMTFVNGSNRSVRWHFRTLLKQCLPEVAVRSVMTVDDVVTEIGQSFVESQEDTVFRTWVNEHYSAMKFEDAADKYIYHDSSVRCGIHGKKGVVPPGYFLIDEYRDYHCIIFPEAGWINDQLNMTEKAMKCFCSQTFAAPLGGSSINQLYNEVGFYTAWNLLPKEHQKFDSIKNHDHRYSAMVDAMHWLYQNPQVFETADAQRMLQHNLIHALTWTSVAPGVNMLWKIIKEANERRH